MQTLEVIKYTSKGRMFTKSKCHQDTWVVEDNVVGKNNESHFHIMKGSTAEIHKLFPVEHVIRKG